MGAPARTAQKQPIYLFTARNNINPQAKRNATYEFYAKFSREPPEIACNYSVVSIRRLPHVFQGVERLLGNIEDGFLGYIQYDFNGSTAITQQYYPKDHAREISALGYFLELISTHDLLRGWAEKISSTLSPKPCRIFQLKRVRLPVGGETGARVWELRLSKAIRWRVEKLRRFADMGRAA